MTSKPMNPMFRWLVAVLMSVAMAACGGGGADNTRDAAGAGASAGAGGGAAAGPGGSSTPPPDEAPQPEAPSSWRLAIQPDGPRALRLDWPGLAGATAYEMARDDGSGGFVTLQTLDGAATSHRFAPLRVVDTLRQTYRVRACIGADCSQEVKAVVSGDLHQAAGLFRGDGMQGFGSVMSTAAERISNQPGERETYQWLAVGAPGARKVMVYERLGSQGEWALKSTLSSPSNESDDFGASIALSPDGFWLAVGAPGDNTAGAGVNPEAGSARMSNSGAVHIYRRVSPAAGVNAWAPFAFVKAFNPGAGDRFGTAVSIAEGLLVVGAPFEDSGSLGSYAANAPEEVFADATDGTQDQGAVYLYRIAATTPPGSSKLVYLKPWAATSKEVDGARFGTTLAFAQGQQLAVGAPRASLRAGNAGAVLVYSFNWSLVQFVYQATIGPRASEGIDRPTDEGFGSSLSLNNQGNLLAVGYPARSQGAAGDKAGAAYLYERTGDLASPDVHWRERQSFESPTPYEFNRFGKSVYVLSVQRTPRDTPRSMLLVGAWGDSARHLGLERSDAFSPSSNSGPYRDTGAAFYYEELNGEWSVRARMKAAVLNIDEHMGEAVAITKDGGELLMGSPSGHTVVAY